VAVGCNPLQDVHGVVLDELVPQARYITGEASTFLRDLAAWLELGDDGEVAARRAGFVEAHEAARTASLHAAKKFADATPVHPAHLATSLHQAICGGPWVLANGILKGWPQRLWDFGDTGEFLGRSGGEGLGYGMPASLGAALACRDSAKLVVNVQADGDLLYTASALWTAAHHQLPLLTVMHNNTTYGKDELHQQETARLRGRPLDTTHIGIRLDEPAVDFAQLASAQGVEGIGPVHDPAELPVVLANAARTVREERRPVLVDVRCSE
jgi:benzoylformate decarboxylase/acetolactate synthase-1/2/3 large subunit